MHKMDKIIITGAAGLVGQNLILLLNEYKYRNIIAIDKNKKNLDVLKKINPDTTIVHADLATIGDWQSYFLDADIVIILHAQITSKFSSDFERNNIDATKNVLKVITQHKIQRIIHISSSVLNSVADDDYTKTKREQENLVIQSGIPYCILRPTLMFGWFDRKHLGWLSRFMKKTPVFPIPGDGNFIRQPLYSRDFCRIIMAAIEKNIANKTYDIVGQEEIRYIDMIKLIKKIIRSKTIVMKIPYNIFYIMLKIYGLFTKNPPFTDKQLKALTAGDYFEGINYQSEFSILATPLETAFYETFSNQQYSKIVLDR